MKGIVIVFYMLCLGVKSFELRFHLLKLLRPSLLPPKRHSLILVSEMSNLAETSVSRNYKEGRIHNLCP